MKRENIAGSSNPSASSLNEIRRLLSSAENRPLRIAFCDGDIFRLRSFQALDSSIYAFEDQWTATVVEPVRGRHPDFVRLFRAGSGVDFLAVDIVEISADESREVLYRAVA